MSIVSATLQWNTPNHTPSPCAEPPPHPPSRKQPHHSSCTIPTLICWRPPGCQNQCGEGDMIRETTVFVTQHVLPSLCKSNTKVPNFDGKNILYCSDKGVV